jgi:hypothetical protein
MKKLLLILPILIISTFVLTGCEHEGVMNSTAQVEQTLTEENQQVLLKNQAPPKLDWSLERDNLIKRTKLWNDKNKISYIYLINYGKVMAFYTIKGKVSSVNSQLTNTEQLSSRRIDSPNSYRYVDGVLPSPSEDGSYGSNGNSVFFFTTEGAYVEWQGDYMLADQPLKLTQQPELVREIK